MHTRGAVYPRPMEVVLQEPTNQPTHVDNGAIRPPHDAGPGSGLRRLDEKAIRLWRITLAARGLTAAAALVGVGLFVGPPLVVGLLAGLVAVTTLAAVTILPPLQYRRWRFGLEGEHLRIRHGVLFHTTSIVPYARIQHVDTRHGPLDRWLGLASLVVFTAGTRGAILTIPALAADEAEGIRDRLAALSGVGDAV